MEKLPLGSEGRFWGHLQSSGGFLGVAAMSHPHLLC